MKISIGWLSVVSAWVGLGCFSLQPVKAASFTLDFDNLPGLNATTLSQSRSITDVNAGSNTINGVTFEDGAFRVAGDEYRTDPGTPGPTFGLPRSGRYFLTNANRTIAPSTLSNDNVIITTSKVLTEAWFGRNEYYGFAGGASSVTVTAFGASGDLGSVTLALPDTNIGLADPTVRMDTSGFLSLAGITGYRISRVEIGTGGGNWVGDDFTFADPVASVPEPGNGRGLVALGLLGFVFFRRSIG